MSPHTKTSHRSDVARSCRPSFSCSRSRSLPNRFWFCLCSSSTLLKVNWFEPTTSVVLEMSAELLSLRFTGFPLVSSSSTRRAHTWDTYRQIHYGCDVKFNICCQWNVFCLFFIRPAAGDWVWWYVPVKMYHPAASPSSVSLSPNFHKAASALLFPSANCGSPVEKVVNKNFDVACKNIQPKFTHKFSQTARACSSLLQMEAMDLWMPSYSSRWRFRTGALDSTSWTISSKTLLTLLLSCFSSCSCVWQSA